MIINIWMLVYRVYGGEYFLTCDIYYTAIFLTAFSHLILLISYWKRGLCCYCFSI